MELVATVVDAYGIHKKNVFGPFVATMDFDFVGREHTSKFEIKYDFI